MRWFPLILLLINGAAVESLHAQDKEITQAKKESLNAPVNDTTSSLASIAIQTTTPVVNEEKDLELIRHRREHIPYFSQHDIHQFIEKIRQKGFSIYNDCIAPVKIKFIGYKDDHKFTTSVKVQPKKEFCVDKEGSYFDIRFRSSNTNLFLNLEKVMGSYRVTINHQEKTPFIQSHNFKGDFTAYFLKYDPSKAIPPLLIPYGPQYLVDPPTNLEDKFIDQYDGHLRYFFNVQFVGEKIKPDEYFFKLNNAYKLYSLDALKNKLSNISRDDNPKIPLRSHTIWLTSPDNPIEFPDEYIYWLKESINACPTSQGFKHWFWVSDKKKLPKTMNKFKEMDVEVHEVSELGHFTLKPHFEKELSNKRFGRSSDIFRIVVLKKFGGIYKDTDYRFHQSFAPLLHLYNFFSCREPMSSFIGNAVIAASPDHPVINEYLALLERNYGGISAPPYIQRIPEHDGFKTILMTGPGVLTTAVANALGKGGGVDIIFPHEILFPTPVDAYPQLKVIKPDMAVPPSAMGVHYWETSWARPKDFGSVG